MLDVRFACMKYLYSRKNPGDGSMAFTYFLGVTLPRYLLGEHFSLDFCGLGPHENESSA